MDGTRAGLLIAAIGALLVLLLWPRESSANLGDVTVEPPMPDDAHPDDTNGYTLGERNNNPGNIRPGAGFNGETGSNGGFATFDTAQNGIRAIFVNLKAYKRAHGIDTPRGVAERWSKTDQAAYASTLARYTGVGPDDPIDLYNALTLNRCAHGIIKQENGRIIYSDAIINDAQSVA